MLCSFFTACILRDGAEVGETLTLLNSVDGHVTMEPAIVLR